MTQNTILIAEDDHELNASLKRAFELNGYIVDAFTDGQQALNAINNRAYDALLLDLMLPKVDGLQILRRVRGKGNTPVILVTAKGAEEERITGLRHGADDYVAKPFNLTELELRVAALIRRATPTANSEELATLTIDSLTLCQPNLTAKVNQVALELTDIQFQLLWLLAKNLEIVLTKAELSEMGLNRPLTKYDRSIDMHISRIRKKLTEINFSSKRIVTVHGKGFCFK